MTHEDYRIQKIHNVLDKVWARLGDKRKKQVWYGLSVIWNIKKKTSGLIPTGIGKPKKSNVCNTSKTEKEAASEVKTICVSRPHSSEWERLELKKSQNPIIDVVIPVYDGLDETLRCIFSVLKSKNETDFELIIINDSSPNPEISKELRELNRRVFFTLLENKKNLGFVQTANKGLRLHDTRHVILLNSDTEVYDHWVDKILSAYSSQTKVGSITPLSNNATICSYPIFVQDNWQKLVPEDSLIDSLAYRANNLNLVKAPTGVGFCMFVSREGLNSVGYLSEEKFGRGYGEENDLCQRLEKAGFQNFIFPGMFVRHYGGTSFGKEYFERKEAVHRQLEELHPNYFSDVKEFIARDPLLPFRVALDCARLRYEKNGNNSKPAILYISHSRGGGTETFIQNLIKQAKRNNQPTFVLRPQSNYFIKLECNPAQYPNLQNLSINYDLIAFVALLRELNIQKIHVNSFVDYPHKFPSFLALAAKKLKCEISVTLHDYHLCCSLINLFKGEKGYCFQIDEATCSMCCKEKQCPPTWHRRETYQEFFKSASKITVPSQDMLKRIQPLFPKVSFNVLEHEEEPGQAIPDEKLIARIHKGSLVLGVVGAISKAKGYDVLQKLADLLPPSSIVLAGYSCDDIGLRKRGILISGLYKNEAEVRQFFQIHKVNAILIPSLWPETHSYTLSIALRTGLPVFAFDCGAPAERLRQLGLNDFVIPLEYSNSPHDLIKFIYNAKGNFIPYSYPGHKRTYLDYFVSG